MSSNRSKTVFRRPLEYDEAIVTSMVRYGEADCIVRLFCKKKGFISAFVKNGLKPSKSRGSVLQAPSRAKVGLLIKPNAGLVQLVEVDIDAHIFMLSRSLRLLGWASYIVEISEIFLPELEPAPEVFDWIDGLFKSFANEKGTASQLRAFELKLLRFCGYLPDLKSQVESSAFSNLDDLACKAAFHLVNSSLETVPDYEEPVLRMVAKIFWNQLRSFHRGSLHSVEFLKSVGV